MKKISINLKVLFFCCSSFVYAQQELDEVVLSQEMKMINSILNNPIQLDSLVNLVYWNSNNLKSFDQQMYAIDEDIFQNKKILINGLGIGVGVGFLSELTPIGGEFVEKTEPRFSFSVSINPEKIFLSKSKGRKLENLKQQTFFIKEEYKVTLKKILINSLYEQQLLIEDILLQLKLINESDQFLSLMKARFKSGNVLYSELRNVESRNDQIKKEFLQIKYRYLKAKSDYQLMIGKI